MVIRAPKGKEPYRGTTVGVEQSKAQITKLLRDYGAEGVAWSDNFQTGAVTLTFVVNRDDGRAVGYRVTPAAFKEKHSTYDPLKGRSVTIEAPNWPRAMRLLHAWLKTKLESIAFGLVETEEEFLSQMVVRDSTGAERTAGELVLSELERTGGRLAISGPPPKRPAGTVTEVRGEVVG